MALAQISPNSVTINPAHGNPQVRSDQSASTATASQTAAHAIAKTKTDTVTISRRAVQMAAQPHGSAEKPKKEQTEKAPEKIDIRV